MAKFSFREAIDAMGQVATGAFIGQAQGMQQAQQQNNQMFNQAMNVAQMQDQQRAREMQERGNVLDWLGKYSGDMTPEGRAALGSKGLEYYQTGGVADPYQPPAPAPIPAQQWQSPVGPASSPMGAGVGTPFTGMLGQVEQQFAEKPGIAPPTVKSPLGNFPLAGVNPKDAKGLLDKIDKDVAGIDSLRSSNPQVRQALSGLIQQRPTKIPTTPEEYQAANQWYNQWLSATAGLKVSGATDRNYDGRIKAFQGGVDQLQSLGDDDLVPYLSKLAKERDTLETESEGRAIVPGPFVGQKKNIAAMEEAWAAGDIPHATKLAKMIRSTLASTMKPNERNAAISAFLKEMHAQPPENSNNPDIQRALAEKWGIPDFVEGLEPGTLKFGGEELEKRWEKAFTRVLKGHALAPGAQRIAMDELRTLSRLTGRRVTVTEKELFAMPEKDRLKMYRDGKLFDFKVSDHNRKVLEFGLRKQNLELGLEGQRLTVEGKRLDNQRKRNAPNKADTWMRSAQFGALKSDHNKAYETFEAFRERLYLNLRGTFDPERPGADPKERKAAEMWKKVQSTRGALDTFIQKNGGNVAAIEKVGAAAASGEDTPKTTPAPSPAKPAPASDNPTPLSANDKARVKEYLQAGKFDVLLAMPGVQSNPKTRAAVEREYHNITGRPYAGGR